MEAKKLLIGLGLAGAAWYAYRQFQLYQGLQFGLIGVGLGTTDGKTAVKLKISMKNPTGVSATLQGLNGNVYSDGIYVAHVTYEAAQIIQPYDRTIITLNVFPDLSGALQSVAALINRRSANFVFRGGAVVDNIPIPVQMDYTLGKTSMI